MIISWLLVIVVAYLFFALSGIGDKVVLAGPPKPISYTFYVGALNILAVLAIPFMVFQIPNSQIIFLIILDAVIFMLAMYIGFLAVEDFEISKVVATIGAVQPVFIFLISWIFLGFQKLSFTNFVAFILLFLGSVFISFDKKPEFKKRYLKLTMFAGLMYSADYVLLKIIFSNVNFASGFILRSILLFVIALAFLIKKQNRKEIFTKKGSIAKDKKTQKIFLVTQAFGGLATILQSFAIFLAPIAFLPIVNAMRGLQYVFIFIITLFFSLFFPKILKEKVSKKIIWQKLASILLIVLGLGFLIF
jgi:drug/metabolite transporter (DMT)-like permease